MLSAGAAVNLRKLEERLSRNPLAEIAILQGRKSCADNQHATDLCQCMPDLAPYSLPHLVMVAKWPRPNVVSCRCDLGRPSTKVA